MFTKEEITAAQKTRRVIIEENIDELKAIYMAGEVNMWNEMQVKNSLVQADVIKAVCDNCKGDLKNHNGYIFCKNEKCGTIYEQTVL